MTAPRPLLSRSEQRFTLPTTDSALLQAALIVPKSLEQDPLAHEIVVIAHPNPQEGGTMDNKVVVTIARVLHDLNITNLRFNFRVMQDKNFKKQLKTGQEDLQAVIKWIQSRNPQTSIHLAGFSFGASMALKEASVDNTFSKDTYASLVTIAPPVDRYGPITPPSSTTPWMMIGASHDDIVPMDALQSWFNQWTPSKHWGCKILPDAGHFFHGCLQQLYQTLHAFYQDNTQHHENPI